MNPFSAVGGSSLATAVAMSLLLTAPALAQQDAGEPLPPDSMVPDSQEVPSASPLSGSVGNAIDNPHAMLGELNGGPDGSPTALRGNPLPGTSTSIPTANPAPVMPLPERQGQVAERETTGIEGQCDPVVGLGNCPDLRATDADMPQSATSAAPSVPGEEAGATDGESGPSHAAPGDDGNGAGDASAPPASGTTNEAGTEAGGATN